MSELLPVLAGLALGASIGLLRPRGPVATGLVASIVLGLLATVVSGESRLTWAYLLVDIPLVGLATVSGMLVTRRLRTRIRSAPPPRRSAENHGG